MANHYDFDGRVALVTGGASGIGAATAARLSAGGADVHIFDLANGQDVRDPDAIRAAVDELPRLDVLVCAAGVGGDSLHTEDVSDDEWRRVHAINLDGVFYANRAALPKMKENGYGRIVNVASIAGKEGQPDGRRVLVVEGGGDRPDEGDRQGRRRQRRARQLHRARGDRHADPRARSPRSTSRT